MKLIFRKPSISGSIIKEYSSTEVAVKTLNNIQKLSNIGKVLSRIVFIFCIIGFCGCIVGILSMALGAPTLKIGGVTLDSDGSVALGVMFIVMSLGCRYGAELREGKE